ncbi:MAG: hypothetical protein NVSMB65_07340 [Chloroflexota bacterium]
MTQDAAEGVGGVRRRRDMPVILAACSLPRLARGSRVLVQPLDDPEGAPYLAEVVFGPEDVLACAGCVPAARVVRPATTADMAATPDDGATPGQGEPAAETGPLWLASTGGPGSQHLAAEAAKLLALVEEGSHDLRGFAGELPVLGEMVPLESGGTALVLGISYRTGPSREATMRARLENGEEVRGPLPAAGAAVWSPVAPAGAPDVAESPPQTRRGRRRRT